MRALKSPTLICAKAVLFVAAGLMAAGCMLLEDPQAQTAVLLSVTVWCFARAYYFAFHVMEHYVDSEYRFTGLWSLARHVLHMRGGDGSRAEQ